MFLPDIGWRSLDPTHARQPDERYVKIAVGRDHADVPPTRGHYKGITHRTMDVDVSVDEILGEGGSGKAELSLARAIGEALTAAPST